MANEQNIYNTFYPALSAIDLSAAIPSPETISTLSSELTGLLDGRIEDLSEEMSEVSSDLSTSISSLSVEISEISSELSAKATIQQLLSLDASIVHLSGDETLSGPLYKRIATANPAYGTYTLPAYSDTDDFQPGIVKIFPQDPSKTLLQQLLNEQLTVDYSYTINSEYGTTNYHSAAPEISALWPDGGTLLYRLEFAPDTQLPAIVLVFEGYGLSSEPTSISDFLRRCQAGEPGTEVTLTNVLSGSASAPGAVHGYQAVEEFLEAHRDSVQYLTSDIPFALVSDVSAAASPLSSSLQQLSAKALTAESDPKFTAWKDSYGAVSASTDNTSTTSTIVIGVGNNIERAAIGIGTGLTAAVASIAIGNAVSADTGDIVIGHSNFPPRHHYEADPNNIVARNIVIGNTINDRNISANGIIAIGSSQWNYDYSVNKAPHANADFAIQLGAGTNDNVSSFQVYDYQVLDSNGAIPVERLKNAVPISGGIVEDIAITNSITKRGWLLKDQISNDTYNGTVPFFGAFRGQDAAVTTDSVLSNSSLEIGYGAKARFGRGNSGNGAIAIGGNAETNANFAIQLGTGTNSTSSTFQVWDYQLLNEHGDVPAARVSAAMDGYVSKAGLRYALSSELSAFDVDSLSATMKDKFSTLARALSAVMSML